MIPPFFAFEHKKALSQYYISLGRTINKPVVPPKFGYNPHFPAQDKFRCHISVTGEPGEAYYYFSSQLKDGLGIFSIKARTDRLLSENPRCLLFLIIAFVFNFYYYTTKFDRCQDFIYQYIRYNQRIVIKWCYLRYELHHLLCIPLPTMHPLTSKGGCIVLKLKSFARITV